MSLIYEEFESTLPPSMSDEEIKELKRICREKKAKLEAESE